MLVAIVASIAGAATGIGIFLYWLGSGLYK